MVEDMTPTLEQLKAAMDVLDKKWQGYGNAKEIIRSVLEAAISKMETTTDTECLCCGGTDGKCLSKDAEQPFKCPDGLSCSGDGSDCVGTRRCEQPVVDVEELLYEITAHIKEKHDRETSLRYMPCVAVVLFYITARYTLTKREGM